MSTDYMISPLFSYGGTVKGTSEESIGGGDTWMTIGKSGKMFELGKSIKPKELKCSLLLNRILLLPRIPSHLSQPRSGRHCSTNSTRSSERGAVQPMQHKYENCYFAGWHDTQYPLQTSQRKG